MHPPRSRLVDKLCGPSSLTSLATRAVDWRCGSAASAAAWLPGGRNATMAGVGFSVTPSSDRCAVPRWARTMGAAPPRRFCQS